MLTTDYNNLPVNLDRAKLLSAEERMKMWKCITWIW